jgi:hypothetical protein
MKAVYPQWVAQRNMLQQYAMFILVAKGKGVTGTVLASDAEKRLIRDCQFFAVGNPHALPSVFLLPVNLSAAQKGLNEDEMQRIAAVLRKHMGLVKHAFLHYGVDRAPSPLSNDAKPTAHLDQKAAPAASSAAAKELDVMGFLQFCSDCNLVRCSPKSTADPKLRRLQQQLQNDGRMRFTKMQIVDIFLEFAQKFGDDGTVANGESFAAALVHLAVLRYSHPVTSSSPSPAPAANALETFLTTDVLGRSTVMRPKTCSFIRDCLSTPVQKFFVQKRPLLRQLFSMYATDAKLSGRNYLIAGEFAALMTDIIPQALRAVVSPTLPEVFKNVVNTFVPEPGPAEMDNGLVIEETKMVHGELEIGIAAIAVHLHPLPFEPLESKLVQFFEHISPLAAKMIRSAEDL